VWKGTAVVAIIVLVLRFFVWYDEGVMVRVTFGFLALVTVVSGGLILGTGLKVNPVPLEKV
jgi:hypothetical protein